MAKLSTIIFSLLLALVLTTSVKSVLAVERVELDITNDEQIPQTCTPQVFEIDADEDSDTHFDFSETSGKVEITFNDTDGTLPSEDDRDQVVITAAAGYEIANVQYELEHYSGIGWTTVPGNNPTTTITLAGTDDDSRIDEVEVEVQTVCPTATPTETPTVTPTPSNPGGPGDGLSDGRSDGRSSCPECTQAPQVLGTSTGQVLGASTMAGTGNFSSKIMNLYMIFGMFLLLAGYASYAKERRYN